MILPPLLNLLFLLSSCFLFIPLYIDATSPFSGLLVSREIDSVLPIPLASIFLAIYIFCTLICLFITKFTLKVNPKVLPWLAFLLLISIINTMLYSTNPFQHVQFLAPVVLPALLILPTKRILILSSKVALVSLYTFLLVSLVSSFFIPTLGPSGSPFITILGFPIYSALVSYPAVLTLGLGLQILLLTVNHEKRSPTAYISFFSHSLQYLGSLFLIVALLSLARKTSILELATVFILLLLVFFYRAIYSPRFKRLSVFLLALSLLSCVLITFSTLPIKQRVVEFFNDPSTSGRGGKYAKVADKLDKQNNALLSFSLGVPSGGRIGSRGNHNLVLDVLESYGIFYTFIYFYLFLYQLVFPIFAAIRSHKAFSILYPLTIIASSITFGTLLNVQPIQLVYIVPFVLIIKLLSLLDS